MKMFVHTAVAAMLAVVTGTAALAQDAVKVDPKHYKVLVDNAQVRVLKIHYGPHETSVMHAHPNSVITYLSDASNSFLLPSGKTIKSVGKAGTAAWAPAGAHKPTNLSGKPMDAILVELKSGKAK